MISRLPVKGEYFQAVGHFVQETNGEILVIVATAGVSSTSNPETTAVDHIVRLSPTSVSCSFFVRDSEMLSAKPAAAPAVRSSALMCEVIRCKTPTCPVCVRPVNRNPPVSFHVLGFDQRT